MGGTIEVESDGDGRGSTFRLILQRGYGEEAELCMAALPALAASSDAAANGEGGTHGPPAHGLATGSLLAADVCGRAEPIRGGALPLSAAPGLGVVPDEAALARLRVVAR